MLFENDILFLVVKTMLVTILTLGMICSTTELKYSPSRVLLCFAGYLVWVAGSSLLLISLLGWMGFLRVFVFSVTAPAVLLVFFLAKGHVMQAVFNYMTQIDLSMVLLITGTLLNTWIGGGKAGDLLIRILLYSGVILLEYRYVRKPFRRIASTLDKNWLILALVPVAFCALTLLCALFPVHFIENPWAVVQVYALTATMLAVYVAIFQSLLKNCAAAGTEKANLFLSARTQSLQQQLDAQREGEEHMFNFGKEVEDLLRAAAPTLSGELACQAKAMAERIVKSREQAPAAGSCRNRTVYEAVLLTVRKLEREGVQVKCGMEIPTQLYRIEPSELAAALSAALEMSVHGNAKGKAELYTCYVNGQLAVEATGPCGNVTLDEENIPVFPDEERRERAQAIKAFAAKFGERPYYRQKDGLLYLRLLIDDAEGVIERCN